MSPVDVVLIVLPGWKENDRGPRTKITEENIFQREERFGKWLIVKIKRANSFIATNCNCEQTSEINIFLKC